MTCFSFLGIYVLPFYTCYISKIYIFVVRTRFRRDTWLPAIYLPWIRFCCCLMMVAFDGRNMSSLCFGSNEMCVHISKSCLFCVEPNISWQAWLDYQAYQTSRRKTQFCVWHNKAECDRKCLTRRVTKDSSNSLRTNAVTFFIRTKLDWVPHVSSVQAV